MCSLKREPSANIPEPAIENMITNGRTSRTNETRPHTRAVRSQEKAHLPPNLDLRYVFAVHDCKIIFRKVTHYLCMYKSTSMYQYMHVCTSMHVQLQVVHACKSLQACMYEPAYMYRLHTCSIINIHMYMCKSFIHKKC